MTCSIISDVMYPMHTCRRLVSTLHRNSIDQRRTTALASTRGTSTWEQSQARGQHDNLPVLIQPCRMSSVASLFRCFTLAARAFALLISNPIRSLGGPSASRISRWETSSRLSGMPGQTTGCLSAPVVYHEQMSLYSANSSPCLEGRDSLARKLKVDGKLVGDPFSPRNHSTCDS